jgi:NADPH2:quinone reductase
MRAALFRRKGPAHDVLSVEDVEAPAPAPGEVRVRVAVSGVNPTDWKERSGSGPLDGLPFKVPDQDGAGVVEAVGAGVDPGRVGERVWLYFAAWQRQFGSAAECCALPAAQAVPLPEGASFDLGASLGIPALTAHRCLFADGPLDGRTVLVQGGAGAVGHAAIQLARWRGARVLATVSDDEKAALARDAGADVVVDYRHEDAAERLRDEAPDGVDRVVEVALHHNADLDRRVIAPHAAIVSYADGGPVTFGPRAFMAPNAVLRFVLVYTMPQAAVRAAVEEVGEAVAEGVLTGLPVHRFGLDRIADAHDAVERGAVGKVLVDVG